MRSCVVLPRGEVVDRRASAFIGRRVGAEPSSRELSRASVGFGVGVDVAHRPIGERVGPDTAGRCGGVVKAVPGIAHGSGHAHDLHAQDARGQPAILEPHLARAPVGLLGLVVRLPLLVDTEVGVVEAQPAPRGALPRLEHLTAQHLGREPDVPALLDHGEVRGGIGDRARVVQPAHAEAHGVAAPRVLHVDDVGQAVDSESDDLAVLQARTPIVVGGPHGRHGEPGVGSARGVRRRFVIVVQGHPPLARAAAWGRGSGVIEGVRNDRGTTDQSGSRGARGSSFRGAIPQRTRAVKTTTELHSFGPQRRGRSARCGAGGSCVRSPPKRAFAACLAHWSWSPPFAMATDPRDATRRHRARS